MVAKKVRIRKAPTTREQSEAVSGYTEDVGEPSKPSIVIGKLPRSNVLGFIRQILRPLRWLVPTYFVNSWREVRQVTWPSRRETWRLTLAVFIFAVVFGALIASVDKGLDLIFKKVVLKQ